MRHSGLKAGMQHLMSFNHVSRMLFWYELGVKGEMRGLGCCSGEGFVQVKSSERTQAPLKSYSTETVTNISPHSHLSREGSSSFYGQMEQNLRQIK